MEVVFPVVCGWGLLPRQAQPATILSAFPETIASLQGVS